jgi:signal transduction histidine kinase
LIGLTLAAVIARWAARTAEARRASLSGQVETLTDANDLLSVLARVARTLPNAYNLTDALDRVRLQLSETFSPHSIMFVSPSGDDATWRAEITAGVDCPTLINTAQLPAPLRDALADNEVAPVPGVMTAALRARGELVGLLMLVSDPDHPYDDRHRRLLAGLADVLALTIDNGRLFGRLRSFGAETERNRIARDLHDRLGQWLTYIGLELERILRHEHGAISADIDRLHHDVQTAMVELRETLRDLRTTISAERGFDVVAVEVLDRFRERTGVTTDIDIATPGGRVDLESEHEMLRILQEALHNIDKHAHASAVDVRWSVFDAGARLVVIDDGQGFDETEPRNGSYGLVGMRERAVGIGATLQIESRPGAGTTLVVETTMERAT